MANDEMREYWNGEQAEGWVRAPDLFDAQLAPFIGDVIDAAALSERETVLDVGCGTGALARAAAAAVGPAGSVTGLDISAALLGAARRRSTGLAQVSFVECDVQTGDLTPYAAAAAISRFGVMFFEDPAAAFANLARGVVAGGRLAFVCWRSALENEWIMTPMGAVVGILGMPDLPGPGAPGPFQMGEADFVREALGAGGWRDVEVVALDRSVCIGGALDLDAAVAFLMRDAIGRRMLAGKPEGLRAQARAALRDALAPHMREGEGVVLGAAAWIVTGRLPG